MTTRARTTPSSTERASRRRGPGLLAPLLAALIALGSTTSGEAAPAAKAKPKLQPAAVQVAPTGPATPPADASPMAALDRANAQLKKLLAGRKPNWSPEAEARSREIQKIVGDFLDFEELARRALAKHWDGLTPAQRTEFVKTLRELAERNYVRQFYGQPAYELKLDKEERNGSEATVTGNLLTSSKGKKVSMSLEYKLIWKPGRWVVYDVITDELSLLENYRAEFNKVIAKEGFDALMKRMRKKLNEKPAE